jgi:hypothetical protein
MKLNRLFASNILVISVSSAQQSEMEVISILLVFLQGVLPLGTLY